MTIQERLLLSWKSLATRLGLEPSGLGEELIARYSEPHRAFHNLDHIAQVTGLMTEMSADDRLVLAAWFHDVIYEPGHHDNELRSATLAEERLRSLGYEETSIALVGEAILATASHVSGRRDFDALLDADLSILGADPQSYAAYRTAIRREYAALADEHFRNGRMAFVRSVLGQAAIFGTDYCVRRFESSAQLNLAAELRELESQRRD